MKHFLLILLVLSLATNLFSQRDTVVTAFPKQQKELTRDAINVNVNIYPVPVRDNYFTIKSEKEISAIKITNIIGQDIFSAKYNSPLLLSRIVLDNPRRGMYLVVIIFSDETRLVKKVMIEGIN